MTPGLSPFQRVLRAIKRSDKRGPTKEALREDPTTSIAQQEGNENGPGKGKECMDTRTLPLHDTDQRTPLLLLWGCCWATRMQLLLIFRLFGR